jgi:hypothetical protein
MSSPVTFTTTTTINYNCYPTATRFISNNIDYNSLTFSTETEPLAIDRTRNNNLHEFHSDHHYWQHPFIDLLDQQRARALSQDGAFDPTSAARGLVAVGPEQSP